MVTKREETPELPSPGEQIRALRILEGISQVAMAQRLETSQSAVARMESAAYDGHSLSSLRKIAEVLGRHMVIRFLTDEELNRSLKAVPLPEGAPDEGTPKRGRPRKDGGLENA